MEQQVVLVVCGFVLGVIAGYLAYSHSMGLEQMTNEEYRKCVQCIIKECPGEAQTYIKLLNEYMDDVTMSLRKLPSGLEAIIRRVTGVWE